MLYLNSPRFWTLKKAALRKMLMLYLGFTCALPMLYLSFTISTCCLQAPFWGVTRVKRKVLDKMLPVLTLLYSSAKKRCLKRMSLLAVNGVQRKSFSKVRSVSSTKSAPFVHRRPAHLLQGVTSAPGASGYRAKPMKRDTVVERE